MMQALNGCIQCQTV